MQDNGSPIGINLGLSVLPKDITADCDGAEFKTPNLLVFRQAALPPKSHIYINLLSTLTAVSFVRAVPAVVIGVTAPGVRDAALVGAGELIGQTRSRHPGGTVGLVAVVEAVVVAVAAPD